MTTHKWRPLIFNQLILIDIDNKINEIRNHSTKYEKKKHFQPKKIVMLKEKIKQKTANGDIKSF